MTGSHRPPAPGRPVALGDPVTLHSVSVVSYEDERYVFGPDSWGRFGRDDSTCEIPVWEEINDEQLSRVAGELWVADGQLWVRNLSTSHELGVFGDAGAPLWLPPRTPGGRGRACSAPTDGHVCTPTAGEWIIRIRSVTPVGPDAPEAVPPGTSRLGPVPPRLRPVAAALCAPLLEEAGTPSTYDEVARRLGLTRRQARRAVERLCSHYADHLARPRRTEDAGTPTYAYLARLLVHRGLVDRGDLAELHTPQEESTHV